MFPIRDHHPSDTPPYVTKGLIFVNVIMFLLTMPWAGGMVDLWDRLALYPVAVTHGQLLWGVLTHMFLHAGIMHIAGNMLFLWVFGDNLEHEMGHLGFLMFYLACGLAAAGGEIAADPDSAVPMIGASGAIAGVMGGYLLMFPKARVDVIAIIIVIIRRFTIPAWVLLCAWFALQLFSTMFVPADGVAYYAHAVGFIAGVVFCLPLWLRRGGPGFWRRTRGRPPHASVTYLPSRIPEVRR